MNAFERSEVSHYPEVWYLGMDANKIEGEEGAAQNHGYDDDNGSYIKASYQQICITYKIMTTYFH
jgi:dual specificity tyrosine-phosphorylation-regulated kinase 2/3/4